MLRLTLLLLAISTLGVAQPDLKFINLFDASMNDSVSCYRIPAIVTASNGDVLAAIDERIPSCGDLKWSDDINIVLRRSTNNGATWMGIERIVDYPKGFSASDPSFILDSETGEIFLFYNYMDLTNEKDVYYFHVTRSTDNGRTWSDAEDITSQISKPSWKNNFKFITSGRGIQTSQGTLLHCLVNLNNGMHVFGSNDHGSTWFLIDTPITPADESKIVELSDGTWMINSRVNDASIRYIHLSSDEGKTWATAPEESLIDPGCNGSIIRYPLQNKNIMLFSNPKSAKTRENLSLRRSTDDGKSWSKGRTVYAGSSAYSSMTILKNGDIGLFFEKDDYKENVFVRVPFDWVSE